LGMPMSMGVLLVEVMSKLVDGLIDGLVDFDSVIHFGDVYGKYWITRLTFASPSPGFK
jgi:hypothetical protein